MNIRLAVAEDYPAICAYLNTHWRKNHIFTTHKALFDWQHWDAPRQRYNFILGLSPTGEIQGVLGFIPHGQFDPALGFDSIWLCIWHASVKGTGLGRRMLDWLEETFKPTFLATNGASEMSLPLYQARGWETGRLEHWWRRSTTHLQRMEGIEAHERVTHPLKSDKYFTYRYSNHPFYLYRGHHVYDERFPFLVVSRLCEGPDVRALRIVDMRGPTELLCGMDWDAVAKEHKATYIDCVCTGVDESHMRAAGFKKRIDAGPVLPNYFEPYEHRNVDINYAVKAPKGMKWRVVKGDGDGDRPNVLP